MLGDLNQWFLTHSIETVQLHVSQFDGFCRSISTFAVREIGEMVLLQLFVAH